MKYNIDFLVAGLAFLTLIFYHFKSQKRMQSQSNRIFSYFIYVAFADIVLDIVCTVLISGEDPRLTFLTRGCLTLLYLLQIMLPYALLIYARSLRERGKVKIINLWFVPAFFMWTTIILNLKTGWFFYFDANGIYTRGSWYMLMYYFALFYVLIIVIESFCYRKILGRTQFLVIWEFLLIAGTCVVIQAVSNDLLVTGFGIAMGITVLFLTINNPYEYTDPLTRLFSSQYFLRWMEKEKYMEKSFHVLAVDVHGIGEVNNLWGNSIGDRFLVKIAEGLSEISPTPYVFRISGKRFLLLMQSMEEYEKLSEDLRHLFSRKFEVQGRQMIPAVIVCGIVDANTLGTVDDLLGYTEFLSNQNKPAQKYVFVQNDKKTMEGFRYNQEVESYLQTAIAEERFEIYFQPLYSIADQKYVSMESLTRLKHPRLGQVSPAVFIPLAEKNGSIIDIDLQQLRKVCRFVKDHPEIMIQIKNIKFNMSPVELLSPGYSQKVIDIIEAYELEFSLFHFEITETVATEYSNNLLQTLEDFLRVGIKICLDDFGSGFANLDAILKLPFSTIKLDRSLLNNIEKDQQSRIFYQNIVRILSEMGYTVVAEGVETRREADLVQQFGVNLIQGFYYSKPKNATDLWKMLIEEADAR